MKHSTWLRGIRFDDDDGRDVDAQKDQRRLERVAKKLELLEAIEAENAEQAIARLVERLPAQDLAVALDRFFATNHSAGRTFEDGIEAAAKMADRDAASWERTAELGGDLATQSRAKAHARALQKIAAHLREGKADR